MKERERERKREGDIKGGEIKERGKEGEIKEREKEKTTTVINRAKSTWAVKYADCVSAAELDPSPSDILNITIKLSGGED